MNYMELQRMTVKVLLKLAAESPNLCRCLVGRTRDKKSLSVNDYAVLEGFGLGISSRENMTWIQEKLVKILLEQVEVQGKVIHINDLPGERIVPPAEPMEHGVYIQQKSPDVLFHLRTERTAQPRVLRPGDILADGRRVLSEPREGEKGLIIIHLSGPAGKFFVSIQESIPISLKTADDSIKNRRVDE